MSTPLKLAILLCLCTGTTFLSGQTQTTPGATFGSFLENEKWIQLNPDANVSAATLWTQFGKELGLSSDDQMLLIKSETDHLGWTHDKFQQMHKGVPVEFALYKVHTKEGVAIKGNGEIGKNISVNVIPVLSRDEAFEIVLKCVGAAVYYWEVPQYEKMKQHATDDPHATFYPAGELLIVDVDFNPRTQAAYRLAWKFEIFSAKPEGRGWVYVDAHDGSIIKEMNLDMHENFPGTAETRYSGVREIIADSTEVGYVLRDFTRGKGVETYDALDSTDVTYALDFIDDDNYWANPDGADDAATDAHWATEKYYDYMRDYHGFNSYDNKGSRLICYVHYDQNWRNASWAGFWTRYGDAGGDPWTHVDVVGHEFTHGFTWATSALLYMDESGALNESFSDIFGEALQRYAQDGFVDWHSTPAPADTIRSMSNPKSFKDPDTYKGENWATGPGDNGGVHTNSGVQNYWFYLLAEGGTGTNDNDDDYLVERIGFDDAMDIVMRSNTTYLFPTADYFDARQASLLAAEDLFGTCSFQYQQVANAWFAVGVGDRIEAKDFSVLGVERYDLCTVGTSAPVTIKIKHLGCDSSGPVTLFLQLIKSNPTLIFKDTLDIPEGVGPGEVFEYTFSKEFNFSKKGEHNLVSKVTSVGDLNTANNESPPIIVHNLAPVWQQDFRFHTRVTPRTYRDSIAFIHGDFADLDILIGLGRDSTHGVRIQGDRMRYANPVYDGQDLFDVNQRLGAEICMCIDATFLDSLGLQFDLRQTYSSTFEESIGLPQPKSSALRIMADTAELARYFPETNVEDEWQTHNLDLQNFIGTQFVLCFETRTIQSISEDTDSIGDRVFLDNILIRGVETPAAAQLFHGVESLEIDPNPAENIIHIRIPVETASTADVFLRDVNGKMIGQQRMLLQPGTNETQFNLSAFASGIYFVEVRTESKRMVGKAVK
jgi:Zn-dependent metalloprotease